MSLASRALTEVAPLVLSRKEDCSETVHGGNFGYFNSKDLLPRALSCVIESVWLGAIVQLSVVNW